MMFFFLEPNMWCLANIWRVDNSFNIDIVTLLLDFIISQIIYDTGEKIEENLSWINDETKNVWE